MKTEIITRQVGDETRIYLVTPNYDPFDGHKEPSFIEHGIDIDAAECLLAELSEAIEKVKESRENDPGENDSEYLKKRLGSCCCWLWASIVFNFLTVIIIIMLAFTNANLR